MRLNTQKPKSAIFYYDSIVKLDCEILFDEIYSLVSHTIRRLSTLNRKSMRGTGFKHFSHLFQIESKIWFGNCALHVFFRDQFANTHSNAYLVYRTNDLNVALIFNLLGRILKLFPMEVYARKFSPKIGICFVILYSVVFFPPAACMCIFSPFLYSGGNASYKCVFFHRPLRRAQTLGNTVPKKFLYSIHVMQYLELI